MCVRPWRLPSRPCWRPSWPRSIGGGRRRPGESAPARGLGDDRPVQRQGPRRLGGARDELVGQGRRDRRQEHRAGQGQHVPADEAERSPTSGSRRRSSSSSRRCTRGSPSGAGTPPSRATVTPTPATSSCSPRAGGCTTSSAGTACPSIPRPAKKVGKQHDWNDLEILPRATASGSPSTAPQVIDWRDPEPDRSRKGRSASSSTRTRSAGGPLQGPGARDLPEGRPADHRQVTTYARARLTGPDRADRPPTLVNATSIRASPVADVPGRVGGADHQDVGARLEVGQGDGDRLARGVEQAVVGEDGDPLAAVEGVGGLDEPGQVVLERRRGAGGRRA